MTVQPTGVKADKQNRQIEISWSDGHTSRYSFDGLRVACPCVECKGGHANMGIATAPSVVRNAPASNLTLMDLKQVGSYALMPYWSDGHATGMYSWELLRALDPPRGA